MIDLLALFLNNLLPILLAAGAGYLLVSLVDFNPRALSQTIFYVFSPCLIFTLLTQSELSNHDILNTILYSGLLIVLVAFLTWLVGIGLKLDRRTLAAVILGSTFINAGNYGLPVMLFAFGDSVMGYASLYFVTNAILAYTLGVIIASMGTVNFRQALLNLLKIPILYALILALLFMTTGWQVPLPVDRAVTLLGDASIPAMLVLLGVQFKSASLAGKSKPIAISSLMRLLVGPSLALFLGQVAGVTGAARQATVAQSAMPTAVLTTVLATEYDVRPQLVSTIVFVTTLLSPFTLTPILAILGA